MLILLDTERNPKGMFKKGGNVGQQTAVSVDTLWSRLQEIEDEKMFNGKPYPIGMCPFPFRLTGQGFFPGGDGLWRDDLRLSDSSDGLLPVGGIMFVGNDFGTLKSYKKLHMPGYENPLTWKHVKQRVALARLPVSRTFFTNAVVGLRESGTALDKKDLASEPEFKSLCRDYFLFQIKTLRPQLIVVMGPTARSTLEAMEPNLRASRERFPAFRIADHTAAVLFTTHPYGDFNFDQQRKNRDAAELSEAWVRAQGQTRS